MLSRRPILLAIDGNSLTHRAYHAMANTGLRDRVGRPTWAIKGFWSLLLDSIERVGPDAVVIGFDDPSASRRREIYSGYKAHRPPKETDLVRQLAVLPQMLDQAGFAVHMPSGFEADDVTAAAARQSTELGWDCVITTSDRDAFAHISATTSVLRVINGGIGASPLLNAERFQAMAGLRPDQYLDYAALRGDASDNLPGVRGIGEKTATKLLSALDSMATVWHDIDTAQGHLVSAAAGKAALTKLSAPGSREAWGLNRDLMRAEASVSVPLDGTTQFAGALPFEPDRVLAALRTFDLERMSGSAHMHLCDPVQSAPERWLPPLDSMVEPLGDFEPSYTEWDGPLDAGRAGVGPHFIAIDPEVTLPAPKVKPIRQAQEMLDDALPFMLPEVPPAPIEPVIEAPATDLDEQPTLF